MNCKLTYSLGFRMSYRVAPRLEFAVTKRFALVGWNSTA